ncbi:suppressor of fused domain protein [Streptomyces sp. NPDC057854]|uniref:suppressor of fused domain protein n=1 Tax=unclassified Streptomyces TaxID=2593676 RepID=UPI0036C9879D
MPWHRRLRLMIKPWSRGWERGARRAVAAPPRCETPGDRAARCAPRCRAQPAHREPWSPGSHCGHLPISLPYLHGPNLESCPLPDGHARNLWALPVTAAGTAYRREHGHEALEQLSDEHGIFPTDPRRPPVA